MDTQNGLIFNDCKDHKQKSKGLNLGLLSIWAALMLLQEVQAICLYLISNEKKKLKWCFVSLLTKSM